VYVPLERRPGWTGDYSCILRAYIGFSYIKYSRTSFIPFYYITEVLNLRPYCLLDLLGGHPGRRPAA
jgi:hypothetical protein